MEGKRWAVSLVLIVLFPILLTLFAVRLAFTDIFVEFLYKRVSLPPDPMPYELRLGIAKLGLRSVLSNSGMEEFKDSGLFNEREIRHMEDVKRLLSFFFSFLYIALPLWFLGFVGLRSKRDMGKILFFGGILLEVFVLFVLITSVISYDWLFIAFHDLLFDPYSWRFSDEDMLLRVYPMDFWYKGTLYTAIGVFSANILFQAIGFVLWRRSL